MFRAASEDDIEVYSDTVTCFIRKCIDDVVPTKTIRIYPNQKPNKESPEDYQRLQPPVPQTALSVALRATFPQHPIPH